MNGIVCRRGCAAKLTRRTEPKQAAPVLNRAAHIVVAMTLRRLSIFLRWISVVMAVVVVLTGCARSVTGVPVAGDRRPHDIWQLTDDLVGRSPVSPEGLAKILGTELKPAGNGSFRAGPVELGPELTIPSLRVLDVPAVMAVLLAVKTPQCVRLADVQARFPKIAKRVAIIQGGMIVEQWAVNYPWGSLSFAVQQPPGCVQSIDLTYPKIKR